jgi:arylsulfatase A-like enzyme
VLAASTLLTGGATVVAADHQHNVVFILADDLGWTDLGCYGSTFYETPHIDQLAAEGLRFTQAYTAGAVCSPTRSSIMTGQYPVRTGITDYIPGLHPDGVRLSTPYTKTELALEYVTIAEALRKTGYQTWYGGKWHLGGNGFGPEDQGFEVVVQDDALGDHRKDPLVGDRLAEAAVQFLDGRDSTRPFFMFLGFHEPHTPILPHPEHIDRFRAKAQTAPVDTTSLEERNGRSRTVQNDPGYATEIAVLDDAVARLSAKLDALELTESTVVILFSDNGGLCTLKNPGPTTNLPLRSGKGWLYEGGIRVPLIIRAPGTVEPGSVCETPVISTDLFPTLLALAGAPLLPDRHLDGQSLVPLLSGDSLPARTLYWHYPHYHGSTWAPGSAILDGDWKLIEFLDEERVELYNLSRDIGERTDLAADEPARVRHLQERLTAWRESTGAIMPMSFVAE